MARQRVRESLSGTPAFCPLVFGTAELEHHIASDLSRRAHVAVADIPRDVLARTVAFLLLRDSRASYAIEGERPPHSRIERWDERSATPAAMDWASKHSCDCKRS